MTWAEDVAAVREIVGPAARLRAATDLINDASAAIADLADMRAHAICELRTAGIPSTAIAEMAGLSKARITQIAGGHR